MPYTIYRGKNGGSHNGSKRITFTNRIKSE